MLWLVLTIRMQVLSGLSKDLLVVVVVVVVTVVPLG
jgi:hypothetical protein